METPKVRFSHNCENAAELAIPKKVNRTQAKGKIKVKSIVPVNIPIKILKNGKRFLLKDQENTDYVEVIAEQNVNRKFNSQHASNTVQSFSHTNEACNDINSEQITISRSDQKSETPVLETPVNYIHISNDERNHCNENYLEIQNCADKLQRVAITETSKESSKVPSIKNKNKICDSNEKNISYIHCDDSDSDEDIKVVKIVKNNKCKFQQKSKSKDKFNSQLPNVALAPQQEDKENANGYNDFQKSLNKIKSTTNTGVLKNNTCNKYRNVNTKKPLKLQRRLDLMPCAKSKSVMPVHNKHLDKQAKPCTKTRVSFDIVGKASNIIVQPEMTDQLHNEYLKCNLKRSYKNKDIVSKDLLSRPEYNSAVCVMKKLKEIGEEKLIKDVESLPATYKNLVHGKVSAALDFDPYESVYKNLINLSVDDGELPARLTRTKDPEPRNKDVTPCLSQFFKPKSTQEYFILLHPKVFNPISVNTLNAFTISNKINTWRISRDSL